MDKVESLLKQIELAISKHKMINLSVSKASVGWHIEHTLLTISLIIAALEKSNPNNYKWSFNPIKIFVFTFNKIPRGKAKSPSIVIPKQYDMESLQRHLEKVKTKLKRLDTLEANKYFEHPYFGHLKLKEAIKTIAIHTKHHWLIIKDIVVPKI